VKSYIWRRLTVITRTKLTRKGQVTIPIDIRRALDMNEGDRLVVEQKGEEVVFRKTAGVAERTAGMLSKYRLAKPLTPEEERAFFEAGVAAEVVASDES
jgi:AbrB family looped-hinge helix DNA binding protein